MSADGRPWLIAPARRSRGCLGNADAFTGKPDSVSGQEVSEKYFPAGSGDPLVIVSDQAQARQAGRAVAAPEGFA